jgi:hypothetical protein
MEAIFGKKIQTVGRATNMILLGVVRTCKKARKLVENQRKSNADQTKPEKTNHS